MAATWEINITVLQESTSKVRIVGTRTDGEDVTVITIPHTNIGSAEQKTAAINLIKEKYQATVLKQGRIDTIVNSLESAAETNLNQWEIDNAS